MKVLLKIITDDLLCRAPCALQCDPCFLSREGVAPHVWHLSGVVVLVRGHLVR